MNSFNALVDINAIPPVSEEPDIARTSIAGLKRENPFTEYNHNHRMFRSRPNILRKPYEQLGGSTDLTAL